MFIWNQVKRSVIVLLCMVLLATCWTPSSANAASETRDTERLSNMIGKTVDYYKNNKRNLNSWWEIVALSSAGVDLNDGTWTLPAWVDKDPGLKPNSGGTEHIQYIMVMLALGKDPEHAWGTRDLYSELAAQQNSTTGAIGGINKHAWAMMALDVGQKLGADVDSWNDDAKQKALLFLLNKQLSDGGFSLFSSPSDTDITGMVLLGLGHYQNEEAGLAAIERAKNLLKERQLDNGGFNSVGSFGFGDNSNSLSAAVSGLVAAGENLLSAEWTKQGNSPIDAYQNFQLEDGSFRWKQADKGTNLMATEQALIGMLDILHGESTWYRLGNSNLPNPEPDPDPEPGIPGDGSGGETNPTGKKVTFSVEKRSIGEGDITSQTTVALEEGDTAFTLLHRELSDRNIALEYSGAEESTYVQAIEGLGEFDYGPLSGWMYEVNGQFPSVSAGVYELKNGDVLRWRYTTNLGEDLGEELTPGNDEHVINVNAGQSPIYVNQLEIAKDVIKLQFTQEILPEVTSVSNSTYMFIENKTSIVSGGADKQIQLPRDLNTSDTDLISKINNSLSTSNKLLSALVTRIKVGGDQDILFDKFVTIKLLGQGDKEAGTLNANQEFHPIPKYENSSEHNDLEAYAYRDNNDLIIKTKHFSEFMAYSVSSNNDGNEGGGDGSGGNGVDPVPPVPPTPTQSNITFSVEKRSIGQGDIVGSATVKVNEGDTAFTVLQKTISQKNISMDYSGSGASIYVRSIDGLGEFDHGAQSGWMYEVNGSFPDVSAGIYEVKDGDVVRWRYTTNLGKDLGAPEFTTDPGSGSNPGNSNTEQMPSLETTKTYIDKVSSWILQNRNFMIQDNFNDWDVLALARANKEVPVSYPSTLLKYIQSKKGEFRLVTDYERMTLAAIAIGKDPSNLSGTNFLEKIYNNSRMTNQGTNGLVFALIALDAKETKIPADALWTREKLVAELLNQQNQDGGFPISKSSGSDSDIDMTAMALQALSKYQDQVKVKQAVEKALQWLSNQQLENGGFKSFGAESSESISQVMIALTSLDIPLSDKAFVKSKGNLMTAWLTYMNKDGGIAHSAGGKSDYMATQQGLLAIVAYERELSKSNRLYDMTDVQSTEPGKPAVSYSDEHLIASWAIDGVNRATELGYMKGSGTDNARFEPKRNITRAEFTALIARYAGLEASESTSSFIDVPSTSWYAGYVSIAKEKGWISGITKDKFAPNEQITRQEMATILVRMIGETDGSNSSDFVKDQQLIAKWALPYVKYVYHNGIMTGDGGNFRPQSSVTREMTAVIMVRMHDLKSL